MRRDAVAIAVIAVLPPIALAAWSFSQTLPQFSDPCVQWGASQPASMTVPPNGPCRSITGTSETKRQAVIRLLLFPGGILLGSLLGLSGTLARRAYITMAGAGVLLLESFTHSLGFLTLASSLLFLIAARKSTS
jgi:hypothetical protein